MFAKVIGSNGKRHQSRVNRYASYNMEQQIVMQDVLHSCVNDATQQGIVLGTKNLLHQRHKQLGEISTFKAHMHNTGVAS